jgi:hypothetical protein
MGTYLGGVQKSSDHKLTSSSGPANCELERVGLNRANLSENLFYRSIFILLKTPVGRSIIWALFFARKTRFLFFSFLVWNFSIFFFQPKFLVLLLRRFSERKVTQAPELPDRTYI